MIEESIDDYVEVMSTNLLKYTAPDDDAIVVNTRNFDIITQTLDECSIEEVTLTPENDSPTFEFERKN